ncbi:MAG: 4a-hydroxytetrahydrobiopterin dehydratase [Candidatus Paceibacterota bacterium]
MNNNEELSKKNCKPCEEKTGALSHAQSENLKEKIDEWSLIEDTHIEKTLKFKDFKEALAFVNKIGVIAETEGHHPDIKIHNWNKVTLTLSTHSIGGLSENDFILASKIDELMR